MNPIFSAAALSPATAESVHILRARQPRSRAVGNWTYVGSTGCVRRATCVYCGREVATCSAKWRETITFRAKADSHADGCAAQYHARQVARVERLVAVAAETADLLAGPGCRIRGCGLRRIERRLGVVVRRGLCDGEVVLARAASEVYSAQLALERAAERAKSAWEQADARRSLAMARVRRTADAYDAPAPAPARWNAPDLAPRKSPAQIAADFAVEALLARSVA